MLDELFFREGLQRHKIDYIFFGFAVTILGFILAVVLFGTNSSAAQILTISLFLTPAILRMLRKEEMLARKEGIKHLYRNHRNIFEIYIFILLGVFSAYFLLQLIILNFQNTFNTIFSFQVNFINSYQDITYSILDLGVKTFPIKPLIVLLAVGMFAIILSFALSFIYGAGGVFFIVSSASIFSTLILYAMKSTTFWYFSLFFLVFALLLLFPIIISSIGGGVISRAFVHKKIRKKYLNNVLMDGFFLFLIAQGIMVIVTLVWYLAVFGLKNLVL